jgi:hypothetical protein
VGYLVGREALSICNKNVCLADNIKWHFLFYEITDVGGGYLLLIQVKFGED